MPTVVLNDWYRDFPAHTVGGSLYAVPPADRLDAAALLTEHRCRVHVDVIVGPDGHRGVSWSELDAVRDALPSARIDLHLILLDRHAADADEQRAIEVARSHGLQSITMARRSISRQRDRLAALRATGVRLSEELAPGDAAPHHAPGGTIDGVLVMFIEPGTQQTADHGQLAKVARLAPTLPVAVDGGITHDVARRCHRAGAGYLISGRDLLLRDSARPVHHPRPQPGRRSA